MQKGRIYMKGTLLGFLFFGFSYKNLYFREDESEEKKLIIHSRDIVPAFYCRNCGSLLIHNPVFDVGKE